MKDTHKQGYSLVVTNNIDGANWDVITNKIEVVKNPTKRESVKFHLKEMGLPYEQPEYDENPAEDAIAYKKSPRVISGGRACLIGDPNYTTQVVPFCGELVAVPIYRQSGDTDDVACFYLSNYIGSVILDKELNTVYANLYKPYNTFYQQEDAYKLLLDFGPSVLMLMDSYQFDQHVQDDVKNVFELRIKQLKDELASPEQIEEEKRIFVEAFQASKEQYENYQAKLASLQQPQPQ